MSVIEQIEAAQKKDVKVSFKAGDTLKVHFKVVEGGNERIQVFEGVVIQRKGSGLSETFTVRKTSFGIGVERIFTNPTTCVVINGEQQVVRSVVGERRGQSDSVPTLREGNGSTIDLVAFGLCLP